MLRKCMEKLSNIKYSEVHTKILIYDGRIRGNGVLMGLNMTKYVSNQVKVASTSRKMTEKLTFSILI